jgi:hypothetical protein
MRRYKICVFEIKAYSDGLSSTGPWLLHMHLIFLAYISTGPWLLHVHLIIFVFYSAN